ncbi:hypothetical protein MMC25_007038 [Agyrium rufum]|nr:hypothetical protein [Agyrium rufum]
MTLSKDHQRTAAPPDLEILGDQVTIHEAGYVGPISKPNASKGDASERNLVEHMARFRESPLDFLREVSLHVSGTGWRAYDDFIGQPIFYTGFSEQMKNAVLSKPLLKSKIEELAEKRAQVEEDEGFFGEGFGNSQRRIARKKEIARSLQEVASDLTDRMICKMESRRFIRGAYYICTQLLTRAYHQGIHVSSEEVLRLRSVAEQAAKRKHSIIFLPCHRSHIDYVSLQLICYRLGIALPTVVAGENLNMPGIGWFLQHAGAMWIRRTFANDTLYTTLVQSYMDTLLEGGYNIECFVEGTRSRTGKLLPPKFGILGFLMDSVRSGRVDDAIVCPVSAQYDKVIETPSYISELLGNPKPKETLVDLLSASSLLSLKLGRVDVRFHAPWSLKSFILESQARMSSMPKQIDSAPGSSSFVSERTRLLRTMGYKVLSDINAVSVVMPTALIGTVLLTLRGRGVGKAELVRRIEWLSDRVRAKGGRVAHFFGVPTEEVVDRGLEVLGPGLVGIVDGLPEETYYAVDRFQLSFYRNMTIHLFVSEALVSAAMYTRVKQGGGPANQRIGYQDLFDQVSFLSQLFRGEFIYPTEGLTTNLDKTLAGLEADNVISVSREAKSSKIEYIELSDAERLCGRENFDFYCFLIWPFVEASWLGAVSLLGLTPPIPDITNTAPTTTASDAGITGTTPSKEKEIGWVDLKSAQDIAQLLGKTLYHQGDISYFEAVNKETLKNAYTRFYEEGIILTEKPSRASGSSTSLVRLAPTWAPQRDPISGGIRPGGRLWSFIERIAMSRREGKNRRDGATVKDRVVTLADTLGRGLFLDGDESGEGSMTNAATKTRNAAKRDIQGRSKL